MPASSATSDSPARHDTASGWTGGDRIVLLGLVALAALRSVGLAVSPLELGVDEAQYWLWSTEFDFGYYTKPPLTSWIIGLSHAVFGHHEWAVRLPAAWLHLATALCLWRAAFWMAGPDNGPLAGRLAALAWMTLPTVALGSFVISTDTPLLLCWSAGLMALVGVITGRLPQTRGMALAGAGFGAAMLSKYAAIYGLAGICLFALVMRREASPVGFRGVMAFLAGMLVLASPNILWNLANELTTVRHLGDNANLERQSYSLGNSLSFLGAQFATAGPLVFALMFGVLRARRDDPCAILMLCLSAPVILVIMIQAFLSEANANWALAAMPALVLWLGRWLARARALVGRLAIGTNLGLCVLLLGVTTAGSLGPLTPESDPLRRLRGWQILAADTGRALEAHGAATVIADRRATAALLSWHFHDSDIGGEAITVLVIDAD
ncbi:MAG: glycosyltransferase family 39 protein, partial [Pseudomonadota bacterium]|nr:glycosyltransferase family 39 protein [Pseudomonadota bacterium]